MNAKTDVYRYGANVCHNVMVWKDAAGVQQQRAIARVAAKRGENSLRHAGKIDLR